jgi:hypothetical protein
MIRMILKIPFVGYLYLNREITNKGFFNFLRGKIIYENIGSRRDIPSWIRKVYTRSFE